MWWKLLQQFVYSANTVLPAAVLSTGVTMVTSKKQTCRHPHGIDRLLQVGTSYSSFFLWVKTKIFPGNTDTNNSPDSEDHLCRNGTRPHYGPSRENGFGMASVSHEGQWESMRLTWHKSDKHGHFGTPTPFHVGMPLQPPALRNHLARTTLRFGRKSTTLDSGDSYYSSEWLYGTAKKKKTSFTTWQLFRSPGLAPPCLLYLAARSSSFFTNQESQANEHLLPRAVLDEIQTYTLLEFNLGDAGEGGRLSLTSKAWALPYLV